MEDKILKTITRLIVPFIELYGVFIILNGHISPGGGFSGGALLGTSLILYTLVFGIKKSEKKFSPSVSVILESGGVLTIIILGVIGIIFAGSFLANHAAGFPLGEVGSILSGGFIPLLMIAIGLKVASTIITLFHAVIEEGQHESV